MIAHLQRATNTAALTLALYGGEGMSRRQCTVICTLASSSFVVLVTAIT
ncbi:hypothetical protein [Streptomyces sp. NRRL S-495]|nr:hypothetical protein [Streptomyces sp. NRRL S-495]